MVAQIETGGGFSGDDYVNGNVKAAGYRFGVKDAVDEFAAVCQSEGKPYVEKY